jgi:uncharacterized protein (DUF305 family)
MKSVEFKVNVKGVLEHDRRFVAVMAFHHMGAINGMVWRMVTDAGKVLSRELCS